MKRAITALSILCGGLLFINPVADIFAQSPNNKQVIQQAQTIQNRTNKEITNEAMINEQKEVAKTQKIEAVKTEDTKKIETTQNQQEVKIDKIQKEEPKQEEPKQEEVKNEVVKEENNQQLVKEEQSVEKEQTPAEEVQKEESKTESKVEVIDVLNQNQALELLKMYKKDVQFTYEGDENNFQALTQKGLSGYVFFPDYDTDLGFFVDKNTASIYYFHPSGYLELAL